MKKTYITPELKEVKLHAATLIAMSVYDCKADDNKYNDGENEYYNEF